MSIARYHQFSPSVHYYTGSGCLVCGTNLGACIDLGVVDSIEGAIALCEDHARECGVMVGMVHPKELEDRELALAEEAQRVAEEADAAAEAKERAKQTHQYIKDLLAEKPARPVPTAHPKPKNTKASS